MRRPTYGEPLQHVCQPPFSISPPSSFISFLAAKQRLSSLRNEAPTYPEGYEAKTRTKGAIAPTTRGKKLLVNPPKKTHNDMLTMARVVGCFSAIVRQTVEHRAPSKAVVRFYRHRPSPPIPTTSYGFNRKGWNEKKPEYGHRLRPQQSQPCRATTVALLVRLGRASYFWQSARNIFPSRKSIRGAV